MSSSSSIQAKSISSSAKAKGKLRLAMEKKAAENSSKDDVAGEIVEVQTTETISAPSNRKLGFSVGEISGKPRWFVSKQKKFQMELLVLFKEIKENPSPYEHVVETYSEFDIEFVKEFVDLCLRCWPVRFSDLLKSYKPVQHLVGTYTKMGERGVILMPKSEFRGEDTVDLDEKEKKLLSEVVWPELSEGYQINSAEVFSVISELCISLAKVEGFLLKQEKNMTDGKLIEERLRKPVDSLPQRLDFPILVGRAMFARTKLIRALLSLSSISLLENHVNRKAVCEFEPVTVVKRFEQTFCKASLIREFLGEEITDDPRKAYDFKNSLEGSSPSDVLKLIEELHIIFDESLVRLREDVLDELVIEGTDDPAQPGYDFKTVLEGEITNPVRIADERNSSGGIFIPGSGNVFSGRNLSAGNLFPGGNSSAGNLFPGGNFSAGNFSSAASRGINCAGGGVLDQEGSVLRPK